MAILNLEVLMSEDNAHVNYGAMYDAGQAPAEPVDIPEVETESLHDEFADVEAQVDGSMDDPVVEESAEVEVVPVVEEVPISEPVAEEAPAEVIFPKLAVVSIDPVFTLRLRDAPNKDSLVLEMLANDTKVLVHAMPNPDWFKVEVISSGATGFVNSSYVTLADE
jgi:hypothetical protein